jgi:hypothetical protein
MEKELTEGEYLVAGVKKGPIPFTQDPLLKGDKEDMEKDSYAHKGVDLRSSSEEEKDEPAGKKDLKLKKKAVVGYSGSSEDGLAESFNEFKVGDTVCLNNIKNREWIIESIKVNEYSAKFGLRSGLRKMIVNPAEMIVEHIEGVEIHRERFEDSVSDLRKIYENMEIDGVAPEMCPEYDNTQDIKSVHQESRIMERNELYNHIKTNGLHENGDRGAALQSLGEVCGNSMEEIHSVYEDACSSRGNPAVDESYGYVGEGEYNENSAGLMGNLSNAYEQMMQKELEETAKKSDEEGDRSGSTGGIGLTNIGTNIGL